MKKNIYLLVFPILFLLSIVSPAQKHSDPPYLQIVSSENPIVVDGKLDEIDWAQRRYDYLVFGAATAPGDVTYTVTDTLYVKGKNSDSTTTLVKILHHGLDLYISLDSDDESVCKWGDSWDGVVLFIKINTAGGLEKEYKLSFNKTDHDADINFETNGPTGSGEGYAYKKSGTVVNDTTQIDSGYTAELVIHLDQLGYTDPYSEVPVILNIFDPDGYTAEMSAWGSATGSYFKSYWGSEWGTSYRILKLADPPYRTAFAINDTITLDGKLDEDFWKDADSVVIGKGSGLSTGGYYMQWSDSNNVYRDQSMATVKFRHKGTDLYVGVVSNDKSVCKWQGWEADGLFLWMTNKGEPRPTSRMEIKNMFFNTSDPEHAEFQLSSNVPAGSAEGASIVLPGTVAHTETYGPDNGYSLEDVIHTDYFGYSEGDTVLAGFVIWDMDYSSDDAYSADSSDYAPNWWGTQWADVNFEKYYLYRQVILDPRTTSVERIDFDPAAVKAYSLNQNYPNPFNPSTKITYSIPINSFVTLTIYDVLGNQLETLVNAKQNAGIHTLTWNAANYSSGIYFYQLRTENFTSTRKMTYLR
jgi:hypothetical protein